MRCPLDSEMAARAAVLLDVLLVILFGAPERRGGRDFGDNRATEPAAGLEPLFQSSRCRLLGLVVIEDGRAVLSSDVGPLAVQRGRIVKLPEDLQQPLVVNLGWIKLNLNDLGMPGPVRADRLIAWVLQVAAHVADRRPGHSRRPAKCFLNSPEAACPKRRRGHVWLPIGHERKSLSAAVSSSKL